MFELGRLLEFLLLPPGGPLLLILLGLLSRRYFTRLGSGCIWGGLFAAFLFVWPPAVDQLLAPLERWAPPLASASVKNAQAVVILGGGMRRQAPEYGQATVNRLTLERLRYGAGVAKTFTLPLLVSGGAPMGGRPEAEAMAEVLTQDFALKPRWIESQSINTAENARLSAAILKQAGVHQVVLVTHAAHMRRASGYFERAGLTVIPAPTGYFGPLSTQESKLSYLPNPAAAYAGWFAAREWAGLLQQRLNK